MFRPFNFILLLMGFYLTFPAIGFGLFPDYFDFSANFDNFLVLGGYVAVLILATGLAATLETSRKSRSLDAARPNGLTALWGTRVAEYRAFRFLLITVCAIAILCVVNLIGVDMLNGEFSPHAFRLGVATSGNLLLIIAYNAFALATLIATNLTLLALGKSRKRSRFRMLLAVELLFVYATGQRSMIMLVLLSYLFLRSSNSKSFSGAKVAAVLVFGLGFTILLGVARQGDELSIPSLIWQLSVRFDLFFPQFFNFLDANRLLSDIGYGYYHLTFPLQIIPSAFFYDKPLTFLHFINRDMMDIAEGTGNDFTAFAEFIYNYGVIAGAFFYAFYCFIASFLIQRVYRRARSSPVYFAIYFPTLLVYISAVLLTGISNQAHLFAAVGIAAAVMLCRTFVRYVNDHAGAPLLTVHGHSIASKHVEGSDHA